MNIGYLSTIYHTSFIMKSPDNRFLDGITPDINWTLFPTGPAMMDAFKTGEIDVGYIGLPPAMIGITKGLKLKCVAGGHVEGTVMISKDLFSSFDDLRVVSKVLEQFEGETIGTPAQGSIHDVIIRDLIHDLDISIINYPWADFIPGAIDNGEIIAGLGTPSLATVASREINSKIVIPPNKLWPYNPSYGIVVREELINQAPEFINDFLIAHEAACNFIRNQTLEAAEVAAGELGNIDVDFVLETFQISPKYCASLPEEYIKSTMDFVPVLGKLGYLEKKIKMEDIFELKFIQEVHPEPSHYHPSRDVPGLEK
ncbi:ABC transporter substrate-binding protein [Methanobacterium sp.]|uniref:ABC transporter substrate-binding protein n=1 Tax=Methanobacterium sp. TaxID=2164 RepID=UPI0025CE6D9E|nr:ABC transporter substrate-binding protein [Methanobacterium sp.]MBI5460373.1 ABC transporter substrate-binding protein [Methanobacterium sp.]